MDYKQYIESTPNIMLGKPVLKGTRITVELILRKLSEGLTPENLLKSYPGLTIEQIYSCLAYSADVISKEEVIAT